MMTDTVLKQKGLDLLSTGLGMVEAERFITLILHEPFDYTEWRKTQFDDMSMDELYADIKRFKAGRTATVGR
jgi:hypothetical protein